MTNVGIDPLCDQSKTDAQPDAIGETMPLNSGGRRGVKLSIFKNKRTSHPEILIRVYKYNKTRFQEPKIFKQPVDDSSLSGIIHHTGSLVLK